jgi:hypothetical protein
VKKRKSKEEVPSQKQLDRLFQNALAKSRREDAKEQAKLFRQNQKEMNRLLRKQKQVKRDMSQINFSSQHWWKQQPWKEQFTNSAKTSLEEQKAAVWYEAARRRSEVQEAWLKGQFRFEDNGWQYFTGRVVNNLPKSWPELDDMTKRGIIESSYSHWSVPPEGLSTFPTNKAKAKQMKVVLMKLRLPEKFESFDGAKRFLEYARKFVNAGFEIIAVDNKTKQAVRLACKAIEAMPRSFRKADLKEVVSHHLPQNISDADRQALLKKKNERTLTKQDLDETWDKHIQPTSNLNAAWHKTATVRECVFHKRQRNGKLIEQIQFNFESICRQLESFDNGAISNFINAVRL